MNLPFLKLIYQYIESLHYEQDKKPGQISHNSGDLISLTLANRITILRILFVPLFILLIIYYNSGIRHHNPSLILRWSATVLFFITVILDVVDGYIARTRNQITRLGTIIDPLADKALLLSGLLLLAKSPINAFGIKIPEWFLLIVISRDCLLIIGAAVIYIITGNVTVRPRISGKGATIFQIMIISSALIGLPSAVFKIILWIAASLVILSATQYTIDGIGQLEKIDP